MDVFIGIDVAYAKGKYLPQYIGQSLNPSVIRVQTGKSLFAFLTLSSSPAVPVNGE